LLGELTEKSVHNLVTAEKSLLELAMKPPKGNSKETTHKAGPRGRARKVHVGAHKPAGEKTAVAIHA
jgi:hypothetical protein